MRILIAERSLLIVDRLTRTLNELPRMKGITHASTAAGVIRSLMEQQPDVAIVDPDIEGNGGIGLLKNIKHQRPAVVLIVLSNSACSAHRRRCLKAGADFFLDKSHEFDQVPHLIQEVHKTTRGSSLEPVRSNTISPAVIRRKACRIRNLFPRQQERSIRH
jgi:DNA-binding NarL/FixJ family response regulator